jgi:Hemerythrin HHE cation binding domain
VAHFLGIESCGQCVPCKRDTLALDSLLAAPEVDRAAAAEAPHPALVPLLDSHQRLEAQLAALRAAPPGEVAAALRSLDDELHRHLDVAERYLYPLVSRLRPDDGDDIVRYPDRHERNALRLVDQVRLDPGTASPRLVDDIAVDVHRTILELERRVLPELQHHLDAADDERLLAAELTELP